MKMNKVYKNLRKAAKNQGGYAFIVVMILLVISSLIMVPLLGFTATGAQTGQVFQQKSDSIYAADAGVQHAIWQVKYGHLKSTFPGYEPYDYTTSYDYNLSNQVNSEDVAVSINNVWVPKGLAMPSLGEAETIINNTKLMVTGGAINNDTFKITLTYNHLPGETLLISKLGIWIPRGFAYVTGSSNLEANPSSPYYAVPVKSAYNGNEALEWSFSNINYTSLPGVVITDSPMTAEITFHFTAQKANSKPDAVAWVNTSGVADLSYSWDADVRVYKIVSTAADITVECYASKVELRQLQSAMAGNYYAIGNSLLTDSNHDNARETILASSSASVDSTNIPNDAEIAAAYLYWSAWRADSSALAISPLNPDSCGNFNNWNAGTAWSIYSSHFRGHYASGNTTNVTLKNGLDLSGYSGARVAVSWDQWDSQSAGQTLFTDSCGNFNNWDYGTAWAISSMRFRGHYTAGNTVTLIKKTNLDLSAWTPGSVTVSWSQFVGHGTTAPGANDGLDFQFSGDGGSTWSSPIQAFRGDIGGTAQTFSYTLPSAYLTSGFRIKYTLVGFSATSMYCYLDNITVGANGALGPGDGLDFAFSADGGGLWSPNMEAFRGDIGSSATNFSYVVPQIYLTNNFKMRFSLVGFGLPSQYCEIDNIKVTVMTADTAVVFRINGQQVYFDAAGDPQQGSVELTSTKNQIVPNFAGTTPHGFSYACYRDVTDLVRTYTDKAPDPAINYPGHGTYSVGGVSVDINDQWSYAGWSMILIYTSAETQGHQLYLYDKFTYSNQDQVNGIDVDFDHDGQPGGTISGFIVPQPVAGEVNAAKITCFVGEGDECYSGDFLAFNAPESYRTHPIDIPNGYKLWDGTTSLAPGDAPNLPNNASSPNNVWNGKSAGMTAEGVDVDTFYVTWASGLLNPGDTSANIDLCTQIDVWNLVYIIISFRAETTTKGALNYLIH